MEERKREVGRKSERNIVCERAKECICKRDIVREGKRQRERVCERHREIERRVSVRKSDKHRYWEMRGTVNN